MAGQRMVHLDVKPDNIVMGIPPRLIDLSIARSFDQAARATHPLGTDAYMAPEQCAPADHPDAIGPASDVWGLAATLHHAVSGSVPFPRAPEARDSDDPPTRFPQLQAEPQPLPDSTPAPLRELIARALARDPVERPSAAGFAMELQPLVASLPRKLVFGRWGTRAR
jgi:serine/threonine protein kinase